MYLTAISVKSGLPGYCDTDYEYLCTSEFPTEEEFVQFVCESCNTTHMYAKLKPVP